MKIDVGSIAPDFSLYSSDKGKVSLGDFKDKNVVLLFFPLAFTSVCTKELAKVRDNIAIYKAIKQQYWQYPSTPHKPWQNLKKTKNLIFLS